MFALINISVLVVVVVVVAAAVVKSSKHDWMKLAKTSQLNTTIATLGALVVASRSARQNCNGTKEPLRPTQVCDTTPTLH